MLPEQAEIIAKLREIEEQTKQLLHETSDGLQRSRIQHIQGLSAYLRTLIGTQLTLAKKVLGL